MDYEEFRASVSASSRHVAVYAQDRMPSAARYVEIRSQEFGAEMPAVYFHVLEAV
jgi:hypothetical protein